LWEVFLSQVNSILTGKQCAICCSSNIDCFLWRDTCVSSTQVKDIFWTNKAYIHLEIPKLQEVFLSKQSQFLQVNTVLDAPASNTDGFLWEIHTFHHITWTALFGTKWVFPIFITVICRKYCFPKLTEFSQENNVLDFAASSVFGFLWRGTWVSSTQLNRPIWRKQSLSPPWNT
jgi:hypothetical protein